MIMEGLGYIEQKMIVAMVAVMFLFICLYD